MLINIGDFLLIKSGSADLMIFLSRNFDFRIRYKSSYRISGIPRYMLIDENGIFVNAFIVNNDSAIRETLLNYSK